MMSLIAGSITVRCILETVLTVVMCVTFESLVCAVIYKKKYLFVINIFTFAVQFISAQVLIQVTKEKLTGNGVEYVLHLAELPVFFYAVLIAVSFTVSLVSFLVFCRQQNIKQYVVKPLPIKSEHLLIRNRLEKLQTDQIRLEEMNIEMKNYGEEMLKQIKEREILQAKVDIHSGMNRLILMSVNAVKKQDSDEIQQVLSLWQRDALLLCKTTENTPSESTVKDIGALAEAFGVTLEWYGTPVFRDERLCLLFFKAAREALMNAVKHAGATVLKIDISPNGFSFTNDGKLPAETVSFGGGLSAIEKLAWEAGYSMTVKYDSEFNLIFTAKNIPEA